MSNEVDRVRRIISETRDIAFIVGNGVNLYHNQNACSWNDLLKRLWKDLVGGSVPKGVFPDVSYIEFYDLMDLMLLQKARQLDLKEKKNIIHQATIRESYDDKDRTIFDFMSKWERLKQEKVAQYNSNESVHFSDISQIYEIGAQTYKNLWLSEIQNKVVEYLNDWHYNNTQHGIIGRKIARLRAPLLTTNYDEGFNQALNCNFYKLGTTNFSSTNPLSGYWGLEKITDPLEDFGIWHINGLIKYPNSIKLGLSQYMANVEKVRSLIHGGKSDVENFHGKNQNGGWKGYNTWLHIIFNKSLFIFGLGLEKDEVFLRWLLFERIKYFTLFPKRLSGWYIVTKEEQNRMSEGKKMFLQNVGLEVIALDSFKQIYEDIWE